MTELLGVLVARGALRRRASGWYWTHARSAAAMTDLRGSGGSPVRVVEAGTGRLLGTVDAASADGSVHDGAVYVHQGVSYVVESLDLRDGVALVARRDVDFGTWSRSVTEIAIHGIRDEEPGEARLRSQAGARRRERRPDGGARPGDQPSVPQGRPRTTPRTPRSSAGGDPSAGGSGLSR